MANFLKKPQNSISMKKLSSFWPTVILQVRVPIVEMKVPMAISVKNVVLL